MCPTEISTSGDLVTFIDDVKDTCGSFLRLSIFTKHLLKQSLHRGGIDSGSESKGSAEML